MSPDPSTPSLDRLMESYLERQRRGERPSVEEYARQYPELADEIREVFPAAAVMEEFGSAAPPATGPYRPADQDRAGVPAQLDDFRIVREVGRGGMGVVYEAVQDSLGRHVALKVLPPASLANELFRERFRREARAAARLHHSNIVPVFGVGEHEGVHYYAMQFIRGQTLESVLQELRRVCPTGLPSPTTALSPDGVSEVSRNLVGGRAESSDHSAAVPGQSSLQSSDYGRARYFRNVAELGAHVAEALAYAHGQGVIHRDVKPSNLMLDLSGTVWVTDFGLAKVEDEADLTRSGDALGTLRYMAPEQLAGEADARSDVYSLGITLYELATLRQAFDSPLRAQLIDAIRYHEPTRPREREPQVPRDLETIILKATAKEPGRRYQTAAALAEDLRRFVEDRPIRARPAGRLERGWRWCRRNPPLAAALAALVLSLVTGTAVAVYLAVLADRRADAAEQSAEKAKQSELKAQQNEEQTKEALEEAERTLVDSLLQPIGQGGGPPGPLELTALEKLAGLSSDGVRLRFLRTGLAGPESARRLGLRAEQVARAVVGLDRRRKKVVEELLLDRLGEKKVARDVVLAGLALAAALRCQDERLADLGSRLLMEQAKRSNIIINEHAGPGGIVQRTISFVDQTDLQRVLAESDGLTGGLSPARADAHAEAVLAALDEKTAEKAVRDGPTMLSDEASVYNLATLLQGLLKRLPAEQAAKRANAGVTLIVTTARRCAVRSQTVAVTGRSLVQVDYALRMKLLAGFGPWLIADQAAAQAQAMIAEMRSTAADPGKGALIANKASAVRQLAEGLRPLLARLSAALAEKHAAEGAGLLLEAWNQEPAWARGSGLAEGPKSLAPYLPASSAAPLADAVGELLVKTGDCGEAKRVAGSLLELLARLPAEQAGAKADKAAEAVVTTLLATVEKPPQAAPRDTPRQPGRRFRPDSAEGPEPLAQLAVQLKALLQRLPADRSGEHATRAAAALVPALLAADEADESSPLFQAIQAVAGHLPSREASRHVKTWVPEAGPARPEPSARGRLVVLALAEGLPTQTLLAAFNNRAVLGGTRRHWPILERRAEAAKGVAADEFFGLLLGLPRPGSSFVRSPGISLRDVASPLKTLAGRVSLAAVPRHTGTLMERLTRNFSEVELPVLAEVLEVLLSQLPPDQATEHAAQAVQAVVGCVCKERRGTGRLGRTERAVVAFDEVLRPLAGRLSGAQARKHVEDLLGALGKARQADDLCRVAQSIEALSDRVPPGEGEKVRAQAEHALRAALGKATSVLELAQLAGTLERVARGAAVRLDEEHALAARKLVDKTRRGLELPPLAEAYSVVLARVPADIAGAHATALAEHIVGAAEKTKSPLDLLSLARSLRAIGRQLPPGGKQPEALAELLFAAWEEAPQEILTEQIGEAIQAVAALLSPSAAGRAADRVLAALKKANPWDRETLAGVHEALIQRLPDGDARPRRVAAIRACIHVEALGGSFRSLTFSARQTLPARPTLPGYLSPLVTACTPRDLIEVLRSPACTGDVQVWFLAELGRRCRCEFHSIWDAVDRLERQDALKG